MSNYVVVDLEMCKVNSKETDLRQEIIQIGAVLLDETYNIIGSYMSYVSPQFGQVDRFIESLTGIHRSDLNGAPVLKDALEQFTRWLPKDAILVSWSDSDLIQLDDEIYEKYIDIPEFEDYLDNWEDCQITFGEKMGITRRYKLSEALNLCEVYTESGEHDALVDARNTARLFAKMMTEKELKLNSCYASSNEHVGLVCNPFAELKMYYNK